MRKVLDIAKSVIKWIARDGLEHLSISCILTFIFAAVMPVWVAALATLLVGIGKEIFDLSRCGWDVKTYDWKNSGHDLACDAIGILAGALISYLWITINF